MEEGGAEMPISMNIYGWWFEPQVTFKAPLIDTPENVKLAAKLDLGASFTADYFSAEDSGPLSARLMGLPLEPSALTDALRDVPVDRYFTGLTAEALVCILTQ